MNFFSVLSSALAHGRKLNILPLTFLGAAIFCSAQAATAPDTLVLSDGDILHGKLVNEVGGKVTFHTESLGDIAVPLEKIKELHASEKFAVLDKNVKLRGKRPNGQIPAGAIDLMNQGIQVHADNGTPTIPVANAAIIVDQASLDQQINHQPSFFTGWNGAATAGATIVTATQNQFTASGAVGLVRTVPGVTWLNPRDRTSTDFSGSFGKITEPGSPTVKTAIFHADAERDEYISSRFFGLGQVAFDHNFAQLLALQSTYGGGFGYTVFTNPKHELDVKATIQYENQEFITAPGALAPSPGHSLIGSTIAANYMAKLKLFTLAQQVAFVPAFNQPHDYSADETDSITFPTYKNLGFSIGTLDSYLNDPPTSTPPTKHNSFQFTMGLTYAIKSKY